MTATGQAEALRSLVEHDARELALLMRARRGTRDDRREVRAWLGVVFQRLEASATPEATEGAGSAAAPPDDAPRAPQPEDAARAASDGDSSPALPTLTSVAHTTARWLRRLSGPAALGPLRDLWVRSPYPERFMRPVAAARAQRLADACAGHYHLELALNDARVSWMESRCQAAAPGMLRPMRQPSRDASERLSGSELELLRKRGRSKFS